MLKKEFTIFYLFCFSFFISCSNKKQVNHNNLDNKTDIEITPSHIDSIDYNNSINLFFEEFTILLPDSAFYTEEILDGNENDSVYIDIELGEYLENQSLTILNNKLTKIKVEQCFETSIVISDEGPHCDMIDWKHYRSEWVELKKKNEYQYIFNGLSVGDEEKFPEVDIEEAKKAVLDHCGDRWYNLVKDVTSVNEYPMAISISSYIVRISGYNSNNLLVTKTIIFRQPMGC